MKLQTSTRSLYLRNNYLCMAVLIAGVVAAEEPKFAEVVISADFYVERTVLFASFDDGRADRHHIVLTGRDDTHQQRIAVYALENGVDIDVVPVLDLIPGPELIAYDVAQLGGQDGLFFISPGKLLRYDFGAGELVEVAAIESLYSQPRSDDIAPMDFLRDVNDDELDDFVIADAAGFRVRLQTDAGTLGGESLLQESVTMSLSGGSVYFEQRPLVSADMNLDGRIDLATWRGNTLLVYLQGDDQFFASVPKVVTLGLGLLSDAELRALENDRGAMDQDGLVDKRIMSIKDLNGDQLPDIMTDTTVSSGVFDKKTELRLHLGAAIEDSLTVSDTENALLESDGMQYDIVTTDIDGDGKMDLMARKIQLSFGRFIRALLSGSMAMQVQFYKMTDDDTYPSNASYVAKTKVRFSMSSGQVDIPAIRIADFDGAGQQDLMIQTKPDRLSFHYGIAGNKLFAKSAVSRTVDLPRNGDLVATEDINGDGKADLIIRYNEADGEGSARNVRLLLSTPD